MRPGMDSRTATTRRIKVTTLPGCHEASPGQKSATLPAWREASPGQKSATLSCLFLLHILLLLLVSYCPMGSHAWRLHPEQKHDSLAEDAALEPDYVRLRTLEASRKSARVPKASAGAKIFLRGNGVLVGPLRVYLIYYGKWQTRSDVIENFVMSLSNASSSPQGANTAAGWWKIVEKYHNQKGKNVGKVVFGGRTFDSYSQGKDLTNKVSSVVFRALQKKQLPVDSNAVYMVLTSADVLETPDGGFCAGTWPPKGSNIVGYCGWHQYFMYGTKPVPYAFIGNADQCVKRCGHLEGRKSTPNGDVGIDAMVNVLAHELAEAATDWDTSTGWVTNDGEENGDVCNRLWGKVSTPTNKAYVYNMVGQGGMRWLVQLMLDPVSSQCIMKLK